MTQNMLEKHEEYMIEKHEEDMIRTQGRGDAMQYPYLCEHCKLNETHGTNRICDDCKDAGFHLEELHEEPYAPDPYPYGESCEDCQEPDYNVVEIRDDDEEQMDLYFFLKIQDARSAVNIAQSEVDLAQAKLQKSEAMHDISRTEYNLYYLDPFKGKTEIVSARAKLAEAEAEIENAEAALRAAQDAWVWR